MYLLACQTESSRYDSFSVMRYGLLEKLCSAKNISKMHKVKLQRRDTEPAPDTGSRTYTCPHWLNNDEGLSLSNNATLCSLQFTSSATGEFFQAQRLVESIERVVASVDSSHSSRSPVSLVLWRFKMDCESPKVTCGKTPSGTCFERVCEAALTAATGLLDLRHPLDRFCEHETRKSFSEVKRVEDAGSLPQFSFVHF